MSIFTKVPINKNKRSLFNLSHEVKLSCDMGQLIPICVEDVLPGDKFRFNTEYLLRFAPLLAPIMHEVNVYTYYFFVPNRLVWNEWEDFITRGVDGTDAPIHPYLSLTSVKQGSLYDYMGLPLSNGSWSVPLGVNALPFRAYATIWNEYFRDQNLQEPLNVKLTSGKDDSNYNDVLMKCWEKDYFTSALPFTQRGPEVRLPLGGSSAPVTALTSGTQMTGKWRDHTGAVVTDGENGYISWNPKNGINGATQYNQLDPASSSVGFYDPNGTLVADLSQASATTINELRSSIALQRWFENNARGGARYKEQILSHFGVVSPDSRLQRPEFIGGSKSPVVISEVLQTSASDSASPQANMAGHAVSASRRVHQSHSFTEHGFVIGLMCVMPRTSYQQGVPRKYLRFDNMDYAFPEFSHLGEQAIMNKELFYTDASTAPSPEGTFGYTPRYSDYKYEPSRVHGDFRTTLNFWHMSRIFSTPPALNSDFVSASPTNRIFAVQSDVQHLWVQLYNKITAIRPLPKFGVPKII